tara:strand:+ start:66 stop:731 length:666 start_codon:yes stop_codon:yes gene_type:complete
MDLKNQILVALGLNKDEDVNMAYQAKSEDGTIFVSTADELAEGVDVSVLTEDGTTILLPVGEYRTDEGVTFRVDEEGIVAEVLGTEEVEEEVEEEEMTEELEVEDDAFERLVEKVQNLEDAIADLKGDKVEATEEVEELAEEVEVEEQRGTTPKSIKTTEVVEFSIEDLQAENERLKTELAAQPAAAPLNTSKFSEAKTTLSKKQIKGMTSQDRFLYNLNN